MFSYRHLFHAGNHADVIKHVILMHVLQYAIQKDPPLFYLDTHAGAALYPLDTAEAGKNREFESGIGRLWHEKNLSGSLKDYVKIVQGLNPDGILKQYPGSPYFAERVLREHDRLRLFELHTNENRILEKNIRKIEAQAEKDRKRERGRGKRIIVEKKDGFSALKAQLPPPSRRAVVLMDPPYEDKRDYQYVIDSLTDSLKRFANGIYVIWFPVLNRIEARRFPDQLKKLPAGDWLEVTLKVSHPSPDGFGLYGSGVFVINPPWKLEDNLKQVIPELMAILAQDAAAGFTIQSGAGKSGKKKKDDA